MSDETSITKPLKGRRGPRGPKGKGKITKPVPPAVGRGRRPKLANARLAAVYDRVAGDLKPALAAAWRLFKPAFNELAERTLLRAKDSPKAIEESAQHDEIRDFLHTRHEDQVKKTHLKMELGAAEAKKAADGTIEKVEEAYRILNHEACDQQRDRIENQLDLIEHAMKNNLPFEFLERPAGPAPKAITQDQVDHQDGPHVEIRDGIEIPFSGIPLTELLIKDYQPPSPKKRKATAQPEGEPAPKTAKNAHEDALAGKLPRHGGGLLPVLEDMDEDENSPFNAASPQEAEGPSLEEGMVTPENDDIMMPRAAGEADEFGTRLITKKPNRADPVPNNRIMVPNSFEWDDHEIGFRDSTNKWTAARKNTKRFRGKYTDKPNSNFLFLDRRIITYDSTELAEDDFDKELVKKYGLHPTLGIVLPTSNNWSPRDGKNYYQEMSQNPTPPGGVDHAPLVFQGPNGHQFTTSRAWTIMLSERKLWQQKRRAHLSQLVGSFCSEMGIDSQELQPTEADRKEYRREVMTAMHLDPDYQFPVPEEVDEDEGTQLEDMPAPKLDIGKGKTIGTSYQDSQQFSNNVITLLQASSAADKAEEERRLSMSPNAERKQASRPYDAIRDVFTESTPPVPPATPLPAPVPRNAASYTVDLTALDVLAETATNEREGLGQPVAVTGLAYVPPADPQQFLHAPAHEGPHAGFPMEHQLLAGPSLKQQPEPQVGSQAGPPTGLQVGSLPPQDRGHRLSFHQSESSGGYAGAALAGLQHFAGSQDELEVQPQASLLSAPEPPALEHSSGFSLDYPPPPPPPPQSREYMHPSAYGQQMESSQSNQYQGAYSSQPPIDPALGSAYPLPPPPPPPPPPQSSTYGHPLEQQQPGGSLAQRPSDSTMANDFLRTALNPRISEYGSAQPGPEYGSPTSSVATGRTPFSNTAGTNSLPALRPVRSMLGEGTPEPSPAAHPPPGLVMSSTGSYYPPPPPPPPRTYHHSYEPQEPGVLGLPPPPPPPPPPLPAPTMPGQTTAPPYHHSISPPPPYYQGSGPLPVQPHVPGGPPPPPPISISQPRPRSRGGSASSPGGQSTPGGKYRELMPAPVPPHRAGQPNNGHGLKTISWDYREQLKDTTAPEAPPSHGPTTIRGWTHQNLKKPRVPLKQVNEDGTEKTM